MRSPVAHGGNPLARSRAPRLSHRYGRSNITGLPSSARPLVLAQIATDAKSNEITAVPDY
jgi:hypothetical protein